MIAVQGVFDGKQFHALERDRLPPVTSPVPVAILFLDSPPSPNSQKARQQAAVARMRERRATTQPLGMSVKDLVEAGRDR